MKILVKLLVIFTLVATISLLIIACPNGDNGNGNGNGNTNTPETPQPFNDITAVQLVANIKIGINWGDRLDACDHGEGWMGKNWTVNQMETAWHNPAATKAHFTARKNTGFNAIRIPVTWYKAVDANYNIRTDWMARVTEVVNYAIENDMYVILNTHHDELLFKLTNAEIDASLVRFRKIWEQIADNFKNYNEKLIFEGLNEPRTIGAPHEWTGGNAEERNNLNKYYPVFVDVVRNSGGNNDKRILMINTYAANCFANAVNGLVLPNDTVPNKLIVSIHAYEPFNFAYHYNMSVTTWSSSNSADTAGIHNAIQPAYDKFVSQGIPVIIGEFAAADKNNTSARAQWAEYYVGYARSKGIPCFWWDNGIPVTTEYGGMAIFNKDNNNQPYPQIITALMNGVNNTPLPGDGEPVQTISLSRNTGDGYDNWQGSYNIGTTAIAVNNTFTFTYSFKSDVAINNHLVIALLDESGGWNLLSEWEIIQNSIPANTVISGSKIITATSAASTNTNKLIFQANFGSEASAPTLTFTTFTLIKN